jgi:methanogenic corrinoid protein MtbC1
VSDDLPFKLPPVDPAATSDVAGTSLTPELLAGLLADGDDELAAWTLQHAFAEAGRVAVFDGLLRDAMALVGERWVTGQWSIAEEHLASRTLLRTLERIRPVLGPEHRIGPVAVIAGISGEHHMIGLVCLEQVLAEAGWSVSNLGADLPAADLGQFVRRNDVSLVALSAVSPERIGTLADTVRAVREAGSGRGIPVIVGGQIAAHPGALEASGADALVTSLAEALASAGAYRPAETSEPGSD